MFRYVWCHVINPLVPTNVRRESARNISAREAFGCIAGYQDGCRTVPNSPTKYMPFDRCQPCNRRTCDDTSKDQYTIEGGPLEKREVVRRCEDSTCSATGALETTIAFFVAVGFLCNTNGILMTFRRH
jgi:hypothetical protein